MDSLDTQKSEDEDEISDELEFFLSILADPKFDRSEFDASLKELEIDNSDEEFTNSSHRLQ